MSSKRLQLVTCLLGLFLFLVGASQSFAASSEKAITSFKIMGDGTVNEGAKTVAVTVPFGTVVTALVPTISVSPLATINPLAGDVQSFSSPVAYTVTAEDLSTQVYMVTVTVNTLAPVTLGLTSNFAILAGAAVTSTGGGTINGDVGASPIAGSAIGVTQAQVNGVIYAVDGTGPAGSVVAPAMLTTAKGDMTIAYNDAAGRTPIPVGPYLNPNGGSKDIGGMTLGPGLYKFTTTASITTNVTLAGSANDVWIFQIGSTLNVSNSVEVILAGGAQAKNVFWQVGTSATIGTAALFKGTIIADAAITMNSTSTIDGRLLAFTEGIVFDGSSATKPAADSAVATVTSIPYTVSVVGGGSETIINVPFGTSKAVFLAALTKGNANQTWNNTAIANTVVSGNTLVVTAQDGTTVITYTVTVNADPDIAKVAADKAALVDNNIKGLNPDLANITVSLTNPLPSVGSVNASTITWASNTPAVVSNNGQTVNRPLFASGNATVIMTATITQGVVVATKDFTLTVLKLSASSAKAITSFTILGDGAVNEGAKTVAVTVPFGTNVTALVPTISVSALASVNPLSGAANNFSSPATYTVTAEDLTTQNYTVTVTVAVDPDIAKVAADKAALVDNNIKGLNPDLANITVSLTNPLPSVGSVNASTITWASNTPAVVSNNGQTVNRPLFASGNATVIMTATLTQGAVVATKDFTLTVLKLSASSVKAITSFTILGDGAVNEGAKTVAVTVPFGTNVTALVPTISVSALASVNPLSGAANNFSSPATYTVTAEDLTTQNYTVTVTVAVDPDIAKVAADKAALVDNNIKGLNPDLANIAVSLTNPLPSVGSVNASTITWASNTPAVVSNNGQTVNRPLFASGNATVIMTATITQGVVVATKDFTLTVLKLSASSVKAITSFTILGDGAVNEGAKTVAVTVPFGTNVTALVPTISVSALASVNPLSGAANNFSSPATYMVTAEDLTTQNYTVTVTVAVDPDIAKVAADKAALVDNNIKGLNPDLANIAVSLTNPLPSVGSVNASTITWASNTPAVVSNNGQTVNRPLFASGNATVIMTATITQGVVVATKDFTLTVLKLSASSAKAITAFTILGDGAVNEGAKTVAVTVPFGTNVTALVPTISVSALASVNPLSGAANNFSSPATYTVTAEDLTTQNYTVTVTVAVDPDIAKVAADKAALVDNNIRGLNPDLANITMSLTNPLPSVGSVNASTITWASNTPAVVSNNGQTVNRPLFASGNATVIMTATLTQGAAVATKDFTLTVLKLSASSVKAITSFTILGDGAVNEGAKTVAVTVPFGTNVTALVPTISVSALASVNPLSGAANNFSNPVTYTVTAEDLTTQNYTVTVTDNTLTPINLGSTANFAVLSGAAITSTGGGTINGDVGASPIAGAAIGVTQAQVDGTIYAVDGTGPAGSVVDPVLLTAAKGDMTIAYNDAAGRTPVPTGPNLNPGGGNIGGMNLVPGLYKFDSTAYITGSDVTLTGGINDIWIFQIGADLQVGNSIQVVLAGGARAKNVFWQVSTSAVIGTGAVFKGTIIAEQSITMNSTSTIEGRLLAFTAGITFDGTSVNLPAGASANATVTSLIYTVSAIGGGSETITNVPFGTLKADFLAALTKGDSNQTWNSSLIQNPVLNNDTLVVTAPDRTTVITYTVTDPLNSAKIVAHAALTTALGTYTEANYTPANWVALNGFKTNGDTAIDAALTIPGVTSAQNTATAGMAGVQTISQDAKAIIDFAIPYQKGLTVIDEVTHTITVTVPFAMDVMDLVPTISVSPFASLSPLSGVAEDFTSPFVYTVTAQNLSTQDYTVTVLKASAVQPVAIGTSGDFVILAKTGVSTTGTTAVVGDIGVSPAAASYITGFGLVVDASNTFSTSSLVTGKIYAADYAPPTPDKMTTAVGDMETAYTNAAGRTLPDYTELGAGDITSRTLTAGLYKWGTGVFIGAAGVTISGSATDVWIFQIAQTLDVADGAIVTLSGGAIASNIFWQVAGQTTLGTTADMKGIILCQTAIVMNTGATLNGRALAQTAVTMDSNGVTMPEDNVKELANGVPEIGIAAEAGDVLVYKITLPPGQTSLQAQTSAGLFGDCDLYIRYGQIPTLSTYDAKSTNEGNAELIQINDPAPGVWYVMINGYRAYSGVELTVTYTADAPAIPLSLNATQGAYTDKIMLTWKPVRGATTYELWRSEVNNVDLAEKITAVNAPLLTYDDMLVSKTSYKYYYWMRAVNDDYTGSFSNYAYGTTTADNSVVDLKNGTAKSGISGVIGSMRTYRLNVPAGQTVLEVTVSGGTGDCDINVGKGTNGSRRYSLRSGTIENIQYEYPSEGYYFINVYGKTAYSKVKVMAKYTLGKPLPPSKLAASKGTFADMIVLTWTASSGATGYDVYRALKTSSAKPAIPADPIARVDGTEYEDTDAIFGSGATPNIYYYWLKAVNPAGSGKGTAAVNGNLMPLPAVAGAVRASAGTYFDKTRVAWSKKANATSYEVYRTADTDFIGEKLVGEVEASNLASYTLDDFYVPANTAVATKYYYWIKGINNVNGKSTISTKSGSGYVSNKGPTKVVATKGTLADGKIQVTWAVVAGATSYDVYKDEAFVKNELTPAYEETSEDTSTHKYKVLAKYDKDATLVTPAIHYVSAFSATASGFAADAPIKLAAPSLKSVSTNLYEYILIGWGQVAEAKTYRIYRSLTKEFPAGAGIADVNGLTYEDGVGAGVKYYYWVAAVNGAVISKPSASKTGMAAAVVTASFADPEDYPAGQTIGIAKSVTKGSIGYYSIDVPADTTRLVATLSGPTTSADDCDIYVKLGSYPTTASYGKKGVENKKTGDEILNVSNPAKGTWYFMLYGAGTSGYSARDLNVACYSVADIYLTAVPAGDLNVPFKAVFRGRVVDKSGTGIAGLTLMVRNPITGTSSYLKAKTNASGMFSHSDIISIEGEHTFDFFFTDMPDTAKGTASHTVFTTNTSTSTSYFDFSAYLRATPVPLSTSEPDDLAGMQAFLNTSNGWDDSDVNGPYRTMWVDNTIGKVQSDMALLGKLDEGLYLFLYGVEGAGAGNDTAAASGVPSSGLSPVPFIVHVDNADRATVLANLLGMGIIDTSTKTAIDAGKVGVVVIASFEGVNEVKDISLHAYEQLNVVSNIAKNLSVTNVVDGKYSNILTKQLTVTVSHAGDENVRQINVITSSFVTDTTAITVPE